MSKPSVVIIDWREYGDFSAVGQLTKKLFEHIHPDFDLYLLKVNFSNYNLDILEIKDAENRLLEKDKIHSFALNWLKKINPSYVYIRLSPCLSKLELAVKIMISFPKVKYYCHYMDKPKIKDKRMSQSKYIEMLYKTIFKYSDITYLIHESIESKKTISSYAKKVCVLGNFVESQNVKAYDHSLTSLKKKLMNKIPIKIVYFGSIDQEMNKEALYSLIRAIESEANNLIGAKFDLYSSAVKKETISYQSHNIRIIGSSFSNDEYHTRLKESDVLFIAYNINGPSTDFLQDSFSNKLVDYASSGRPILFYGDKTIPTAQAIEKYNLGICVNTEKELQSLLSDHNYFIKKVSMLLEARKQQGSTPREFLDSRLELFKDFKEHLANMHKQKYQISQVYSSPSSLSLKEKILIKQIILDQHLHKESLTSTLMNVKISQSKNLEERLHEF